MGNEFGGAPTYFLLRLAGVGLLFLLCVWVAIRRSRNAEPSNRALGIIFAALVPMVGYPLYFGALAFVVAPILLIYVAYFIVIWIALPAIGSAVVADVVLRLLGAMRTWLWLVLGIALAVATTFFWMVMLLGDGPVLMGQLGLATLVVEYAMIALVPASSALIWWAYLPPAEEAVAGAFE